MSRMSIELELAPSGVELRPGRAGDFLAERHEALLERARAEGRAQGERAALEGPAKRLDEAVERLEAALVELRAEAERNAVELALGIARQLVRAELSEGTHDVERIVRDTLAQSGVGRGACVVHLHPADFERLRNVVFRAGTKLEADEDVPRGSVHVTTPKGLLVHEVDACLDAITERLRGELR